MGDGDGHGEKTPPRAGPDGGRGWGSTGGEGSTRQRTRLGVGGATGTRRRTAMGAKRGEERTKEASGTTDTHSQPLGLRPRTDSGCFLCEEEALRERGREEGGRSQAPPPPSTRELPSSAPPHSFPCPRPVAAPTHTSPPPPPPLHLYLQRTRLGFGETEWGWGRGRGSYGGGYRGGGRGSYREGRAMELPCVREGGWEGATGPTGTKGGP
ncbi:uncharacterized protein H6S33_012438 [Morchella sextelata]|uniref:uncharacterized protein n=1 Tax=Morchella sextelata TaxID=1174677 RepID=UPI001D042DCF|nr:uncharacterized protein H6S33_012438 [Morchella sextelata]KAH0609892.1 hypothetical protein H6S33_012438 [Morchella sextelata]